jgi:uncharacterized protein YndB with AHSA1/START domain
MTGGPISIAVTRHYEASAERVFDSWLDPACAAKWFFASPQGQIVRAEIDPVVGGEFRFIDRRDDEDIEHVGEYLEIDRPRRLSFVFSVNESELSTVTVEIAPADEGCDLTLTHDIHPRFAAYAERSKQGWEMMLDGLARALA